MKELIDFDNPNTQVEDIIKVGIARYKDKYFPGELWIVRLYYTKNIPEEM